jgi:hypothetical protein
LRRITGLAEYPDRSETPQSLRLFFAEADLLPFEGVAYTPPKDNALTKPRAHG